MMGLYLAVFDGENELDGVEVGAYSDFADFRDTVVDELEGGESGSLFPTLILHSDCDGEWTPSEAAALEKELKIISERFQQLPPIPLASEWKKKTARTVSIQLNSLYDCFFDVNGEPLLERLIGLTRLCQKKDLPILFQ